MFDFLLPRILNFAFMWLLSKIYNYSGMFGILPEPDLVPWFITFGISLLFGFEVRFSKDKKQAKYILLGIAFN